MKTVKLSEWCANTGVSYLTAWRWFKNEKMPVHAYQTKSGTILVDVDDESYISEDTMVNVSRQSNDALSLILKKTIELSKNNSPVEDLTTYILENFTFKLASDIESTKKSKKEVAEGVKAYYKNLIKPKGEKPKVNGFFEKVDDESCWDGLTMAFSDNTEDSTNTVGSFDTKPTKEAAEILKNLALKLEVKEDPIIVAEKLLSLSKNLIVKDTLESSSSASESFKPGEKEISSFAEGIDQVAKGLRSEAAKMRKVQIKTSRKK